MILTVLTGMAALSVASTAPATAAAVHRAEVPHQHMPVSATYSTVADISTYEVHPHPAMRPGLPVCRWQASLALRRDVQARDGRPVDALAKPVHSFSPVNGVEMGRCDTVMGRVEARVAAAKQRLAPQAAQTAERDRAALLSEIDSVAIATTAG